MTADPWQVLTDVMYELQRGGQTAPIRCRAALTVLQAAGITITGYGKTADAIRNEVDADNAKDAEIKRLTAARDKLRAALEQLADPDTWILGEGLGGGHGEEFHVRASFAAQALGRDVCGCTDCMASLSLDPGDQP